MELQKKYGFWTATAMVVGIVIGSGVFFKADDVLKASSGSLSTALLAWMIGGAIMVVTAYVFSHIATRIERVNGVVDYFEAAYGESAGYMVAWFMTLIYYPTITCVLAWVSANYTAGLFGVPDMVWFIAAFYLVLFFVLNIVSPVLAGKWQVSATIIKLIPLALVAVFGTVAGLVNGQTVESFATDATNLGDLTEGGLAVATLSTAFAYEGWIIATSINAELKDAKRTLPKALVFGTIVVALIYMLYYLGISGVLSNDQIIAAGDKAPVQVMNKIFGNIGGTLLTVFVIISCLGTLNGLVMGCARGMFSIASRDLGPKPEFFKAVSKKTNSTVNSALIGFVLSAIWLVVWYGNFNGWWAFMDISELPIAFLYVIYTSLYVWYIKNFTDLSFLARVVAPLAALCGSLYIIYGAVQKSMFITFLVISIIVFAVGLFLKGSKK